MTHSIHSVASFKIEGPWRLRVRFGDRTERSIDFRPVLFGELFGPLNDLAVFNGVKLDPEVRTLVWPNGADFDPETLHDWPDHLPALVDRVRGWAVGSPPTAESSTAG